MKNYLEIDPDGLAVGGVYQKGPFTNDAMCINWVEVSNDAQVGWTWDGSSWVAPPAVMVPVEDIRVKRDQLLLDSDWRVSVSDYPNADIDYWITYRALLRDFPSTYIPTEYPEWPTEPSG